MTELEMKIDDYMKHAHHPQVNSILVWEQKTNQTGSGDNVESGEILA